MNHPNTSKQKLGEAEASAVADSGRKKAKPPLPAKPAVPEPPKPPGHHFYAPANMGRLCTGSDHHGFATKLISDVVGTLSMTTIQGHENHKDLAVGAAMEALKAFEPKDPIEGMIAAQAVALNAASMECLRRALLGQTPEVASKLRKDGANLARAMTDMLAALDRKRGKGQQHIRVERVMVSEGGRAIVGNVTGGSALPPRREESMAIKAEPADKVGVTG